MFAKLINENQIENAPRCIHVGATTYVMPNAAQYAEGGYYEVVETEKPEERKWYHLVANYALDEKEEIPTIVKNWIYEKDERPDYGELIVGYIREVYSLNDELAIQRQWDNSAEKKVEFNEYNAFCDGCKLKAKADIAEWENA